MPDKLIPKLSTESEAELSEEAALRKKRHAIKEGLSEIYQNEEGELINVQTLAQQPARGLWFWLLSIIGYGLLLVVIGFGAYYWLRQSNGTAAVSLTIEAEPQVVAGQEFYYVIKYANQDRIALNNVQLYLEYPKSFIFLESSLESQPDQHTWQLGSLEAKRGGEIRIKGKIINTINSQNIILGNLTYQPANFSSEFKKVASLETVTSFSGLELEIIRPQSAQVNEDQSLVIKYRQQSAGFLDNFRLTVSPAERDNVKLLTLPKINEQVSMSEPWVFMVNGLEQKGAEFKIDFKFLDKLTAKQNFALKFEYRYQLPADANPPAETIGDKSAAVLPTADTLAQPVSQPEPQYVYYVFQEESFDIEVVKNNLNLNLILNGSDKDQSVNFGQRLNYSLSYANRGNYEMQNVVLMAVLQGDLLDWETLQDKAGGSRRDDTLIWTKDDLPGLVQLAANDRGVVDFSIEVKSAAKARASGLNRGVNEIKSLAQFEIRSELTEVESANDANANASNVITVLVNSDLQLLEQIRYFNDDNLAVGSGPLPPKVGENTGLRVYWQIDNTLHDVNNLQVVTNLPNYISWQGKEISTTGKLRYDVGKHQVIWEIDYLPLTTVLPRAEFNISLTPGEQNRNQLMIILVNSKIVAHDTITNADISRANSAKTTKLDDEVMIDNNGVVQ